MTADKPTSNKPPILLLHGFRGSPLGLAEIADVLRAADYEVLTPAVPPFSGAKLPAYTPEAYVSYWRDYITSHRLQQPILIGHSMGSVIASAVAHAEPDLIHQKLILLSPISVRTTRLIAPLVPLSTVLPRSFADYITTRFLFVPHDRQLFKKSLTLTHQCSSDQPPRPGELFRSAQFSTHYSVADFPFQKDTFFLTGESDRIISKKHTQQLAERISAELEFIPDSGHIHNYEKPRETAEAILRFLAK